jgi:phage terminase large subunit-like protein
MKVDPEINRYINDVMEGREKVGNLSYLRVKRHLDDLKNQKDCYFDPQAGMKAVKFFSFLKHAKGRNFAGNTFELSPWQKFDTFVMYGWMNERKNRRFRYGYIDIARKNGKTTLAAGHGLYLLVMDQEPGAEVYTVATKREQARICLDDARNITKSSKDLAEFAEVYQHSVICPAMGSSMKSLSSDSNTLDGLNPHGVILDEFHAHKDDLVFNVMKSAMGARTSPLMLILTTAGFNRNVPCYRYRDTAIKVLNGTLTQDDQFISIHTLDPDDDYEDENNWVKSNPNLNISVNMDYLRGEFNEARNNPDQLYNFLTKNLNLWTDSAKTWITPDTWDACNLGIDDLEGADCYGGLDLASVRDTNALALRFQKPDGRCTYRLFFWMPEMNVLERVKDKGINYDVWIREGYLKETPGNVTDYDYIKKDIIDLCERYNVQGIGYDRWNSSQLVIDLIDQGVKMEPVGQGYGSLSAPTKEFEKEVLTRKMNHEGNPLLKWHISNVFIQRDPADNIKIDKSKSSEKVDGAVACVMAKFMQMRVNKDDEIDINEIYGNSGIRTL